MVSALLTLLAMFSAEIRRLRVDLSAIRWHLLRCVSHHGLAVVFRAR